MYNLIWSNEKLTTQKLTMFCKYYAKMELTSYGINIYTSEVADHGIDFVVKMQKGFLKFQIKSVRKANYVWVQKKDFNISDNSLFMYLILLTDNEYPKTYIIPASAWNDSIDKNKQDLFVYHRYDKPEYGLNLSKKNIEELKPYCIENMLKNLSCKFEM